MSADPQPGATPLLVGVLGEPELMLSGLTAMLRPYADRVRVVELGGRLRRHVDVLLLDPFTDQHPDALVLIRRLSAGVPTTVVVFSWSTRPDRVAAASAAGAHAFVSKGAAATDIVSAIEVAHRGDLVDEMVLVPEPAAEPAGPRLPAPELQVLGLIERGLSNAQISDALGVSIHTVKGRVSRLYRRIGVSSRSQAVSWAVTSRQQSAPAVPR